MSDRIIKVIGAPGYHFDTDGNGGCALTITAKNHPLDGSRIVFPREMLLATLPKLDSALRVFGGEVRYPPEGDTLVTFLIKPSQKRATSKYFQLRFDCVEGQPFIQCDGSGADFFVRSLRKASGILA